MMTIKLLAPSNARLTDATFPTTPFCIEVSVPVLAFSTLNQDQGPNAQRNDAGQSTCISLVQHTMCVMLFGTARHGKSPNLCADVSVCSARAVEAITRLVSLPGCA
ncbi:MAG: hypothetical protein ACK4VZ_01520 [Paracoccaceae bacterium]